MRHGAGDVIGVIEPRFDSPRFQIASGARELARSGARSGQSNLERRRLTSYLVEGCRTICSTESAAEPLVHGRSAL
jgi:hypothetical protein